MAISYPVDVANTRWAIWRVSTQELVKHGIKWPRADGQPIENLEPDLVPLLEVELAQPAYNAVTQALQRSTPVVDVIANTHSHGWTVVARPQADIDADAELVQLKALYAALKAHSGTTAERFLRLENVVARMLRDTYGS